MAISFIRRFQTSMWVADDIRWNITFKYITEKKLVSLVFCMVLACYAGCAGPFFSFGHWIKQNGEFDLVF